MTATEKTGFTSAELSALAELVDGPVLTPTDEGYATETATWNLAVAHRPLVAVGATAVADVQAAVRFAAAHDLPIAVVATGHGMFVSADGAVLINLRRMRAVTVDAATRSATVGPAVEWQAVIDAAAQAGLAPLAGSSPNVGVVGYTLGGGLSSTLGRAYGYAADHVESAEIVTADGELRIIDASTEPDLFWAVRGGKGNFGVVTSLRFGLFPHARLYGGGLFFTGEHVRPVLAAYRRLLAEAPDELTLSFAFLRLPPLPFVPPPLQGRFILHVRVSYLGSAEAGERFVAGLRAAAPAVIDSVAEMPFTAIGSIHADPVEPVPAYERSLMLTGLPDEAVEALLAVAGPDVDTPALVVEVRQLGGALGRAADPPNAVGHREGRFQLFLGALGAPGMADAFAAPTGAVVEALRPWSSDVTQINFLGGYDTAPDRVATAYDEAAYERLTRIKARYDPANLFRVNHNIPPRR